MGYSQLKTIADEQRRAMRDEQADPPVACPIDGSLLQVNGKNQRNCPYGNYRWNA